ncbi:MAG: TldD/PmbA family protein, partial [Candidatus Diapherotrites archaeon]|nr:TldD/PmbA family protein [Candidatus Diapherotrites archaeon]
IINSSGIKAYDKMTHNYAVFGCTMNGKRKSYYGWGESRIKNSDIDMNKISNLVIERATQIMNPVNPPAGKYDLVFDSRFFKTILNSCVLSAFNGSLANVNKRYTSGKLGKKVFSDLLTIKENPNIEYGVGSAGCDTEGIPTKAKILVSKGVVNKFVYTLNDAKKYKTIPTGNSFRESFNVEPHVSFTNLEVSPGKDKVDNIISRTKKGILVYDAMGLHGFNPISGDFALTISDGVMIRDGTLSESVTGLSFAGKIYDLLSNIDTVSKERDQILNFLVPWVSFKSIPMA